MTWTLGYRFTVGIVRVGELARRTGVTIRALRYYEAAGLLVPAQVAQRLPGLRAGIHAGWRSLNGTAPMPEHIARRPHDVVELVRQLQTR